MTFIFPTAFWHKTLSLKKWGKVVCQWICVWNLMKLRNSADLRKISFQWVTCASKWQIRRHETCLKISRRHLSANHSMMSVQRSVLCTTWNWIKKAFSCTSIFKIQHTTRMKVSLTHPRKRTARYLTSLDLSSSIINLPSADDDEDDHYLTYRIWMMAV